LKEKSYILNQVGFTLIEILAVLVILAVLASVAKKKMADMSGLAENRALEVGIYELNVRETLTWTNQKFAPGGYTNDNDIWSAMDTDLGAGYNWSAGPNASGGTLQFRSKSIVLIRTPSTSASAGRW
jgi:prepilin-type N-terminal cleavage/methylation domain-containing protein